MERQKGNSLLCFVDDYTVVDIETTGFSPKHDEIIEIAAIRVRGGLPIDEFDMLVKPRKSISRTITDLTGITNEMLADELPIEDVILCFLEFLGTDVIVGHNINFDINFLCDATKSVTGRIIGNDYVDTMRIARHALPHLNSHSLKRIAEELDIDYTGAHRALVDCLITIHAYTAFLPLAANLLLQLPIQSYYNSLDFLPCNMIDSDDDDDCYEDELCCNDYDADEPMPHQHRQYPLPTPQAPPPYVMPQMPLDINHPLHGKRCVFSGDLTRATRADVTELVEQIGGIPTGSISGKTDYLIVGSYQYDEWLVAGKSSKHRKAEELQSKGGKIQIITEDDFWELVGKIPTEV